MLGQKRSGLLDSLQLCAGVRQAPETASELLSVSPSLCQRRGPMTRRMLFLALAVFQGILPRSAGQEISSTTAGTYDSTAKLAFSKDGQILREFREVSSEDADQFRRVHAITYVLSKGEVSQVWKLQPYTRFCSATSDGRKAIIYVDTPHPDASGHVLLLDTETGRTQDVPNEWFDNDPHPDAAISGDGRFVSAYSEAGPERPMVVRIYEWQTKKLVATQMSELISAGGIFGGGVTEDGKIEFWNNRTGSKIVEPKTGQTLLKFGPNAVRSPDRKWIVELAGYLHGYERPDSTVIDGMGGKPLGNLDLKIGNQPAVSWSGVFCGTSDRMIAWDHDSVLVFDLSSRKQITSIPVEAWRDRNVADPNMSVGCSWNGKRFAIRSGGRLTLHDLK